MLNTRKNPTPHIYSRLWERHKRRKPTEIHWIVCDCDKGSRECGIYSIVHIYICVHYFHLWFVPIKCAKVHRMIETIAYTLCMDLYLYFERGTERETDREKKSDNNRENIFMLNAFRMLCECMNVWIWHFFALFHLQYLIDISNSCQFLISESHSFFFQRWIDMNDMNGSIDRRMAEHIKNHSPLRSFKRAKCFVNGKSDYSYLIYDQCKWVFDVSHTFCTRTVPVNTGNILECRVSLFSNWFQSISNNVRPIISLLHQNAKSVANYIESENCWNWLIFDKSLHLMPVLKWLYFWIFLNLYLANAEIWIGLEPTFLSALVSFSFLHSAYHSRMQWNLIELPVSCAPVRQDNEILSHFKSNCESVKN